MRRNLPSKRNHDGGGSMCWIFVANNGRGAEEGDRWCEKTHATPTRRVCLGAGSCQWSFPGCVKLLRSRRGKDGSRARVLPSVASKFVPNGRRGAVGGTTSSTLAVLQGEPGGCVKTGGPFLDEVRCAMETCS